MALIWLLFNNYSDKSVVVPAIKDAEEGEMSIRRKILESFVITNNDADYILCSILEDTVSDNKKKILNELKSMEVDKKKSKQIDNARDKMCYFGIKAIPPPVEDSEDDKTTVELY